MAVTFVEKKKRQRILILAFLATLFLIAGVVWWGFFAGRAAKTQSALPEPRKIEVDTSILLHPVLQELSVPEDAAQTLPRAGRDNPFVPAE
jgi:hypothetical protein